MSNGNIVETPEFRDLVKEYFHKMEERKSSEEYMAEADELLYRAESEVRIIRGDIEMHRQTLAAIDDNLFGIRQRMEGAS